MLATTNTSEIKSSHSEKTGRGGKGRSCGVWGCLEGGGLISTGRFLLGDVYFRVEPLPAAVLGFTRALCAVFRPPSPGVLGGGWGEFSLRASYSKEAPFWEAWGAAFDAERSSESVLCPKTPPRAPPRAAAELRAPAGKGAAATAGPGSRSNLLSSACSEKLQQ